MPNSLDHAVLKNIVIAYWRQGAGNRPVKLVSVSSARVFCEGYVTCHKFIGGRSLSEAEHILATAS